MQNMVKESEPQYGKDFPTTIVLPAPTVLKFFLVFEHSVCRRELLGGGGGIFTRVTSVRRALC